MILESWAALLWYLPWWDMGWRWSLYQADMVLTDLPNTHALAFFSGPLAVRSTGRQELVFRPEGIYLLLSAWHGRIQLEHDRIIIEIRMGLSPWLAYPWLVLLPAGPGVILLLLIKDVYFLQLHKKQIHALLHFVQDESLR